MATWVTTVCSEQQTGMWTDCTWASGVMVANERAGYVKYPQTIDEAHALRAASGDTGASNVDDLNRGYQARYGFTLPILTSWSAIAALPVGSAMVLQGNLTKMPLSYQPGYAVSAHAVCVVRTETGYRWLDPLKTSGSPSVAVAVSNLQAFFTGLAGARCVWAPVGTNPGIGDDMDVKTTFPIATADFSAGATLYGDLEGSTSLVPVWAGAKGVGVYGRATRSDGKVMDWIRVDMIGGGAGLRTAWIGEDHASNWTLPGTPSTDAIKAQANAAFADISKYAASKTIP